MVIIIGVMLGISASTWKKLAVDMTKNESSTIIDKSGDTIAKVGDEKKKNNLSSSQIPEKLKNAYVAIEDERFYKHSGVDIKEQHLQLLHTLFILGHHLLEEVQ